MSSIDRTSQTINLRDGRKLGFAEWGDPQHKPILLFGGANARFIRHPDDSIAHSLGLRIVTVERPGFGLSSLQPNRRLLDWPDDVAQLADALDLERFPIIGASQGGPYALACAYKIPHRLTTLTLVSSVAPLDAPHVTDGMNGGIKVMTKLALRAPFIVSTLMGFMGAMGKRNPERMAKQVFANLPEQDRALVGSPAMISLYAQDLPESFRHGGKASTDDMRAVVLDWGFRLQDIRLPKVFLWQGEADPNVTPAMARYIAETIPHVQATFVPQQGHFLFYIYWRDILTQLAAAQ